MFDFEFFHLLFHPLALGFSCLASLYVSRQMESRLVLSIRPPTQVFHQVARARCRGVAAVRSWPASPLAPIAQGSE